MLCGESAGARCVCDAYAFAVRTEIKLNACWVGACCSVGQGTKVFVAVVLLGSEEALLH